MAQVLGWFIFLGIFLMAFWILIFLASFLGYWSVMGGLYTLFPKWFHKKEGEASETAPSGTSEF